jgi:integrase/recombinase XerD
MSSTSAASQRPPFPALVEAYFCDYLQNQRHVSPQTIASYRDTFRLFLHFTAERYRRLPASLTLRDLDAPRVLAFLDHLEQTRHNGVRSRNLRLAAIRSFLRYAGLRDPAALAPIQRTLAIPLKRFDRRQVSYLSPDEMAAVLQAPDDSTWSGHRDRALLAAMYNTGARVSEVIGLNVDDLQMGATATLRIRGKGRKERVVPIWRRTKRQLQGWLCRSRTTGNQPLFPNRWGGRMTRTGVRARLNAAVFRACQTCPTLRGRRVSPHQVRHSTAMHLLQSGVDITMIALWLGHESTVTTHMYVEADLAMKRKAIEKVTTPLPTRRRFRPADRLLAFLDAL